MPNANTVTCQAKIEGSFSGSDISGADNGFTIWRMTTGEWPRFHTTIRGGVEPVRVTGSSLGSFFAPFE
jgi:hypothetical protein